MKVLTTECDCGNPLQYKKTKAYKRYNYDTMQIHEEIRIICGNCRKVNYETL